MADEGNSLLIHAARSRWRLSPPPPSPPPPGGGWWIFQGAAEQSPPPPPPEGWYPGKRLKEGGGWYPGKNLPRSVEEEAQEAP
mmetsp:Transcript_22128/g.72222  ORF Transcript_22128/g.72222 Transcript_22128/m.72222 type:complete len:83 (-) Transcript_22128:213-461(-)